MQVAVRIFQRLLQRLNSMVSALALHLFSPCLFAEIGFIYLTVLFFYYFFYLTTADGHQTRGAC